MVPFEMAYFPKASGEVRIPEPKLEVINSGMGISVDEVMAKFIKEVRGSSK